MALRFGIPAEQYNAMGADAQRAQRARHNAGTQGAGGGSLSQPATPELSPYQQFIAAAAEGPDAARAAALRLGATGPGIDTPRGMGGAGPTFQSPMVTPPPAVTPPPTGTPPPAVTPPPAAVSGITDEMLIERYGPGGDGSLTNPEMTLRTDQGDGGAMRNWWVAKYKKQQANLDAGLNLDGTLRVQPSATADPPPTVTAPPTVTPPPAPVNTPPPQPVNTVNTVNTPAPVDRPPTKPAVIFNDPSNVGSGWTPGSPKEFQAGVYNEQLSRFPAVNNPGVSQLPNPFNPFSLGQDVDSMEPWNPRGEPGPSSVLQYPGGPDVRVERPERAWQPPVVQPGLRFGIPADQYHAMGPEAKRAQQARHNAETQGAGASPTVSGSTLAPQPVPGARANTSTATASIVPPAQASTIPAPIRSDWAYAGPQAGVDNRDPIPIPPPKDPERLAAYYRSKAYHDAWNRWFEVMKSRNFIDPHLYPPPEPGDYTGVGGG